LLAPSSFLAPNKPPVGAAVEAGAAGAAAPKSEGADGVVAEAGACDVFPPSEKAGFDELPPSEKPDWPAGADWGVDDAPPRLNMGLLAGAAPSAGFWPNIEVGGAEAEVLSPGFLPKEAKALLAGAAPPRGAPNVGVDLGASAALSSGLPKRGFAPAPPNIPPVDWPGGGPAGVVENMGLFVAAGVVELLPREKPPVGAAAPPKGLPVAATPGVVGLLD